MSRKFLFGVVSVFGLMTFVVSAQKPAAIGLPQAKRNPGGKFPYCKGGHSRGSVQLLCRIPRLHNFEPFFFFRSSLREPSKAEGDDKDKIKTQLTETLGKQFNMPPGKRHEEELKALEAQVKKLKDNIDKRKEISRELSANILTARAQQEGLP